MGQPSAEGETHIVNFMTKIWGWGGQRGTAVSTASSIASVNIGRYKVRRKGDPDEGKIIAQSRKTKN